MRLTLFRDGWCLVDDDPRHRGSVEVSGPFGRPPADGLFVRFADRSGRLKVAELQWKTRDDESITSEDLRDVRLGQLEAAANSPRIAQQIRELIRHHLDMERRAHERSAELSEQMVAVGAASEALSAVTKRLRTRVRPRKLVVPDTRGRYPDSFYDAVASNYMLAAAQSRHPAHDLAEEAGVPVSTVHGWVKEARRRGFLAPGRKKRADA